jgi:hypothetical protein
MHCTCYLRKAIVYIPTLGMMDKGLYRHIEPVAFAPLSDEDSLRRIFAEAFARGNPKVPLLKQPDTSPSVILKYAGVKTWRSFVRDASTWSIDEREGTYKIIGYRKDPPNGWTHDRSQDEIFPEGTSANEVIERMIAILQEAARAQPQ